MFATVALASLFRADHTAWAIVEQALLVQILSRGFYGAWLGLAYLHGPRAGGSPSLAATADLLEPPLLGRFRDPLLGRDVLIGALSAMVVVLAGLLDLTSVLLEPSGLTGVSLLSTLSSPRQVAYFFLWAPFVGVAYSMSWLFMLYLFHAVVRRAWLAGFLLFLFTREQAVAPARRSSIRGPREGSVRQRGMETRCAGYRC